MREDDRRLPGDGIPQRLYLLTYQIERRVRAHFRGTGLHWGLRRILQRLWIEDGLSQKELSDAVGSSETSISNMVRKLMEGEWVERRRDPFDYRISRVFLTDKANLLRATVRKELRDLDTVLRDVLGESDTQALESQMVRLASALQTQPLQDTSQHAKTLADMPSPPGEL